MEDEELPPLPPSPPDSSTSAMSRAASVPDFASSQRPGRLAGVGLVSSPSALSALSSAASLHSPHNKDDRKKFMRIKIVQEIVETERTYVNHLTSVVERFVRPLADKSKRIITPEQHTALFSNIELLASLNAKFLQDLQERADSWTDAATVGDIFRVFVPYFKMYATYINNHNKALDTLSQLKTANRKFVKFLKATISQLDDVSASKQALSSYLIMPIQRVPRYKLLLGQLLKYTDASHPDHHDLERALDTVQTVAAQINEAVHDSERATELVRVQKSFSGKVELVSPGRRLLIEDGPFYLQRVSSPGQEEEVRLFLFSDLLLCGAPVPSSKKIKFKMHTKIAIDKSVMAVDMPDQGDKVGGNHKLNHRILLESAHDLLILRAPSKDIKEKWMLQLTSLVQQTSEEAILRACGRGDIESVTAIIKAKAVDLNVKDKDGWCGLAYASHTGVLPIVRALVEAKCDVNSTNNRGQTPLMLAVEARREGVVAYLLERGAHVLTADKHGHTALSHLMGNFKKLAGQVTALLASDQKEENTVPQGNDMVVVDVNQSELGQLYEANDTRTGRLSYERRPSVRYRFPTQRLSLEVYFKLLQLISVTALHQAAIDGDAAVVNALLTFQGKVVAFLKAKGYDVSASARRTTNYPLYILQLDSVWQGVTALVRAAEASHEEIVLRLLSQGAEVNLGVRDTDGRSALVRLLTPLLDAAAATPQVVPKATGIQWTLIWAGLRQSGMRSDGAGPLPPAAPVAPHAENVAFLFRVLSALGVNTAAVQLPHTALDALEWAFRSSQGGAPAVASLRGAPILHCAAAAGQLEVVKCVLRANADAKATDEDGNTAVALAVQNYRSGVVEWLCEHEPAVVLVKNKTGLSCLSSMLRHSKVTPQSSFQALTLYRIRCAVTTAALLSAAAQGDEAVIRSLILWRRDMARVQPSQHQQEVFELDVNVRHIARSSHGPKHNPTLSLDAPMTSALVVGLLKGASSPAADATVQALVRGDGGLRLSKLLKLDTSSRTAYVMQSKGRTPLMIAAVRGYTGVVELLLKGGARVDVVDTEDNTVLELLFAAMTLGGANRRTAKAAVAKQVCALAFHVALGPNPVPLAEQLATPSAEFKLPDNVRPRRHGRGHLRQPSNLVFVLAGVGGRERRGGNLLEQSNKPYVPTLSGGLLLQRLFALTSEVAAVHGTLLEHVSCALRGFPCPLVDLAVLPEEKLDNDDTEVAVTGTRPSYARSTSNISLASESDISLEAVLALAAKHAYAPIPVNGIDVSGRTVLHLLCEQGQVDMIDKLCALATSGKQAPPLPNQSVQAVDSESSAAVVSTDVVQSICETRTVDLNAADQDGNVALMLACTAGHTAVVDAILAMSGIEPAFDIANLTGTVSQPDQKAAQTQVPGWTVRPVDVNLQNNQGRTALMLCALNGHNDLTLKLIACGADVTVEDKSFKTALSYALSSSLQEDMMTAAKKASVLRGDVNLLRGLMKMHVTVSYRDDDGMTGLMHAARGGHVDMIHFLYQQKVNLLEQDNQGWTALMHAASRKGGSAVKQFIAIYSDGDGDDIGLNLAAKDGTTALMIASRNNALQNVMSLLAAKADPSRTSKQGLRARDMTTDEGVLACFAMVVDNSGSSAHNSQPSAQQAVVDKGRMASHHSRTRSSGYGRGSTSAFGSSVPRPPAQAQTVDITEHSQAAGTGSRASTGSTKGNGRHSRAASSRSGKDKKCIVM